MAERMIRLDHGRGVTSHLRPSEVSRLTWERGDSYAALIVSMRNGDTLRVRDHQGSAYAAERAILDAIAAADAPAG